MRRLSIIGAAALVSCIGVSAAHAAVPVRDQALLDQKSDNASTLVRLAPIQEKSKKSRGGVHCSVTTGRRASVDNPLRQGNRTQATRSIDGVTNGAPTRGSRSEAAFNADKLKYDTTASVMSGMDASEQALGAARDTYEQMVGEVGTTQTVMESFDQNSEIRTQNGMQWNAAIGTLNTFVEALNVINLASVIDRNQASGALGRRSDVGGQGRGTGRGACPVGMTGLGTSASPCVSRDSGCVVSRTVASPETACVIRRSVDSYGNVTIYLTNVTEGVEDGTALTADELQAVISQYQQ